MEETDSVEEILALSNHVDVPSVSEVNAIEAQGPESERSEPQKRQKREMCADDRRPYQGKALIDLYINKDLKQPKTPEIGMNLGPGKLSDRISTWFRMYCHYVERKNYCVDMKHRSHRNYKWICATEGCTAFLRVKLKSKKGKEPSW
jgi:hypothetical protein